MLSLSHFPFRGSKQSLSPFSSEPFSSEEVQSPLCLTSRFPIMALTIGRIYDRKTLWPTIQVELDRRQFDELGDSDLQVYNEIRANNDSLTNLNLEDEDQASQRMSVPFGLRGLNYLDVEAILTTKTIGSKVVDLYMDCTADYVNFVRRPTIIGGTEKLAELPHTGYRAIEPMKVEDAQQQRYLSCRVMSTDQLQQCTSVENSRIVLESMNCSGENFQHLDYLLIAYSNGARKSQFPLRILIHLPERYLTDG